MAIRALAAVFTLTLLVASTARAGVITVPTDLSAGDEYRLVFVTSTTRDALSDDIADYNSFVTDAANSVAELAALGTTWSVIGSTLAVDARDNTGTNPLVDGAGVAIYRLDDVRVADNNADLWDGATTNLINVTESMTTANRYVFTGSYADGTGTGFNHVLGGADQYVTFGVTDDVLSRWIYPGRGQGINERVELSYYAMSGVLVVPGAAVPEPASLAVFSVGAIGLVMVGRRGKRRSMKKGQA